MNCGNCGKKVDERQTANLGRNRIVCFDCEEKLSEKKYWWSSSSGLIELELKVSTIDACSSSGPCLTAVQLELEEEYIQDQVKDIDPELLRRELSEYACWDEYDLTNHEENLEKLLWIASGDVYDSEEYLETLEGR